MSDDVPEVSLLCSPARLNPSLVPLQFAPTGEVTFIWGESCCGQKKDGPQTAPPLVCTDEFLSLVHGLGWKTEIKKCPQVYVPSPPDTTLHEPFSVTATCDKVYDAVKETIHKGNFPMLIGGDHCLALGAVRASAEAHDDLVVIWFDAHADINTMETSPSGNIHGMPMAALLGLPGMKNAPGFEDGRFASITPDRIGYIGLRDVDEGEKEIIKELGITVAFGMADLEKYGINKLTEMILDEINPQRNKPIHVSFDVDGLDPMDAPATGTPVPGGVRITEAVDMLRIIRNTGLLASMDCVEVNPSLGNDAEVVTTVRNARLAMAHALGKAPNSF